jgi:hypothetical protein
LSQRDAQLVLAREYGFAGWQDLREEVLKRAGKGLEGRRCKPSAPFTTTMSDG